MRRSISWRSRHSKSRQDSTESAASIPSILEFELFREFCSSDTVIVGPSLESQVALGRGEKVTGGFGSNAVPVVHVPVTKVNSCSTHVVCGAVPTTVSLAFTCVSSTNTSPPCPAPVACVTHIPSPHPPNALPQLDCNHTSNCYFSTPIKFCSDGGGCKRTETNNCRVSNADASE